MEMEVNALDKQFSNMTIILNAIKDENQDGTFWCARHLLPQIGYTCNEGQSIEE